MISDDELKPPIEVARPRPSPNVPGDRAAPGTLMFQLKIDGWRLVMINLDGRPYLRTRQGRDVTGHFPDVAESALRLPPGTVIDGEVAAWKDGAFDFLLLPGSPTARRRNGVSIVYVAFDVLAVAGRDVRRLPLSERWELLGPLVAQAGSPFERVMATLDRDEAIAWMEALAPQGVEGLVAKPMRGIYRGGTAGDWLKYRRRDTVDALVTGTIGPADRPRALKLVLPDGRHVITDLTGPQSRTVAQSVEDAGGHEGLVVEIQVSHGRHKAARFVRLRDGW